VRNTPLAEKQRSREAEKQRSREAEKQRILPQPQKRVKCPAAELQAGGRTYAESGGILYYALSHSFQYRAYNKN